MHDVFMQAALEQAWLGRGFVAPNPAVGAVAVRDGKIIAQAFHPGIGQPHAEQLLFQQLPDDCSAITLYVTLEPCNHWGKTPPCTDGIVQRRFQKVVYGYTDPNPLVSQNNTPEILKKHQVDVLFYPMPAVQKFYESYAFWFKTGKPWVTVKMAQSFDGKIAGPNGARVQLSNAACAKATHQARRHTDVILTTAKTIQTDNPLLNARLDDKTIAKPIAVIDRKKQLPDTAKVHQTAQKLHVYSGADLNLQEILCDLGQKGYHDVWVEAGSALFNALHAAQLVQRTILYLVPTTLGAHALSLYQNTAALEGAKQVTWQPLDDNLQVVFDWFNIDMIDMKENH